MSLKRELTQPTKTLYQNKLIAALAFFNGADKTEKLANQNEWIDEIKSRTGKGYSEGTISNALKGRCGVTVYVKIWTAIEGYIKEHYPGFEYDEGKNAMVNESTKSKKISDINTISENIQQEPKTESEKSAFKIPSALWGIYIGTFIRPESPHTGSKGKFSRLTLLLTNEDYVIVKSTHTITADKTFKNKYYEGKAYRKNEHTLEMSFGIADSVGQKFEFLFSFDLLENTNGDRRFLYGIYGGADPETKKPVAGRMILERVYDWNTADFKNLGSFEKQRDAFTSHKVSNPKDLTAKDIRMLYEQEDSNKRLVYKEFFTTELRYVENSKIAPLHNIEKEKFDKIEGVYSIYTLHSTGDRIVRCKATISPLGVVKVYGTNKKYDGKVEIACGDNLLITVYSESKPPYVITYLIPFDLSDGGKQEKIFNGVRIMLAGTKEKKPFAGRVVFVKERKKTSLRHHVEEIFLLPVNGKDLNILNKFKEKHPGILNLLQGFENNIIKTFGVKRQHKDFIRDISYGEIAFIVATHFASLHNPTEEDKNRALLSVYYAVVHGFSDFNRLVQNKQIKSLLNTSLGKKCFIFKEIGKQKYLRFNPVEIDNLKDSLL